MQELLAVAPHRQGFPRDVFEHAGDVILDEVQDRQNLADTLSGEILEIAGFEDLDDNVLNILDQALLVLAGDRSGKSFRRLIDFFGCAQNFLCRLLRAYGDFGQLIGNARHWRRIAWQIRPVGFDHAAANCADDQVKLRREAFRSGSGGRFYFARKLCRRRRDHGAQCCKLVHQFGMARRHLWVRNAAGRPGRGRLFNAEDFARLGHCCLQPVQRKE